MLHCHLTRKHQLTEGEYEHAVDCIVGFLEDVNNTRYRLLPDPTPPNETE